MAMVSRDAALRNNSRATVSRNVAFQNNSTALISRDVALQNNSIAAISRIPVFQNLSCAFQYISKGLVSRLSANDSQHSGIIGGKVATIIDGCENRGQVSDGKIQITNRIYTVPENSSRVPENKFYFPATIRNMNL